MHPSLYSTRLQLHSSFTCVEVSLWSLRAFLLLQCCKSYGELRLLRAGANSFPRKDLPSLSIIFLSVPCFSVHSRWLSHKSIQGFFFFLCSSNYPFLSALPCVCLHWTSSDFVLPIHWALLNVIEIEFGLGVEAWGWCSRKALLPRRKKYCEILQLLSPVKSSCVHVTVN